MKLADDFAATVTLPHPAPPTRRPPPINRSVMSGRGIDHVGRLSRRTSLRSQRRKPSRTSPSDRHDLGYPGKARRRELRPLRSPSAAILHVMANGVATRSFLPPVELWQRAQRAVTGANVPHCRVIDEGRGESVWANLRRATSRLIAALISVVIMILKAVNSMHLPDRAFHSPFEE